MTMPYVVEPRHDTAVYNAKMGIWLFLASELMLFGSLFSSYVLLRAGSAHWPVQSRVMDLPIGTANTVVLIISSLTMVLSWVSLKGQDFKKFRMYLGATISLGIVFLLFKSIEYGMHWRDGLYPRTSVFLAIYYLMTGLHALHVIGGVIVNAYFLGPGSRLWDSSPRQFTNRIEVAGLYWHFVDIVWIILFTTLYLL
jgi:heme/copper-type cytochrome/quinol oxidase subunit 3